MEYLSFEDFMKLSNKEKCNRYKDMNSYDKFRARITEPMLCSKPIGYIELTKEQKERGKQMIETIRKSFESND